jgi:predicted RNase H-related nuclease YkuK (DUF458 family)
VRWRTLKDEKIGDIREFVREAARDGQSVHLGTDSRQAGRHTQFVTVVAILTPGKGGRAAYARAVVPRIASLRERLLREVWLSVELGLQLTSVVSGELSVHIDANPVVTHRSNRYVQELVGLVVSQGFRAAIKPESWAATHAADRLVRAMGKRRRAVQTSEAGGPPA